MATRKDADDMRWDAVIAKDKRADGQFYFSVQTTGIYCRPSCPARPALRENVAFHPSCEAAEAAGFRACKRCRPREASQSERHAALVASACALIERSEDPPRLAALAKVSGLSPFHFHRIFKAATGLTPKAYADAHRAERVRKALPSSSTIIRALSDSGLDSNARRYSASAQG